MMRFTKHGPIDHPVEFPFSTLEGLLAHPAVASWAEVMGMDRSFRFVLDRDYAPDRWLLLTEWDEGRVWYVIGYIEHGGGPLDLPDWVPNYSPAPEEARS